MKEGQSEQSYGAWDDDAHHIRSAKRPERTLCGQDAASHVSLSV